MEARDAALAPRPIFFLLSLLGWPLRGNVWRSLPSGKRWVGLKCRRSLYARKGFRESSREPLQDELSLDGGTASPARGATATARKNLGN